MVATRINVPATMECREGQWFTHCINAWDALAANDYARTMVGHRMVDICVTPPVIPPFVSAKSPYLGGTLGRVEPWEDEQDHFRDGLSGRTDHTKMVDYQIMCHEEEEEQ